MIKNLLRTLSFCGIASLFLAIIYNISYFSVFDIRFLSILTIEDHISSGITFLIPCAIGLALGTFLGISDAVDQREWSDKQKKWQRIIITTLYVTGFLVSYFFFSPYNQYSYIFFAAIFLLPIAEWFEKFVRQFLDYFDVSTDEQTLHRIYLTSFFIFILTIFSSYLGKQVGNSDYYTKSENLNYTLNDKNIENSIKIVRFFERGYLAVGEQEIILNYQGKNFVSIKKIKKDEVYPSLSCLIGLYCSSKGKFSPQSEQTVRAVGIASLRPSSSPPVPEHRDNTVGE